MLKSYLKIAWRSIWKDKSYSLINIIGIAIASAVFLLIINFVIFEYSYENFHKKAANIYRITLDLYNGAEKIGTDCETYSPLGAELKKNFPEVIDFVRIQDIAELAEMSYQNNYFLIDKAYAADPAIFSIFNFDFVDGNPATALSEPMQVVLTESMAKRFFGNTKAVGKTLKNDAGIFTVTGVIKDLPANTHLKVNLLLSFVSLKNIGYDHDNWNGNNTFTYVQLRPGTDLNSFKKKLVQVSKAHNKNNLLTAEPIKDIHLYSHKSYEPEVNGDIKTVRFLLAIGILILLIGSINYINLTTARAVERTREVGLKKVLGSTKRILAFQFFTETFLINLIALGTALIVVWVSLPFYADLLERPVHLDFFRTSHFWSICFILFILNCFLSGIYPAVILASVKPISVVRKVFTGSTSAILFRKVLVTAQFAAALIIISAAIVVYRQLNFMKNMDIGINAEEVLVVRAPQYNGTDSLLLQKSSLFKNELGKLSDVKDVTISQGLPGIDINMINTTTGITRYGSDEGKGYNYFHYGIDANFIPVMGLKLIAGSNFREGMLLGNEVIINETASRLLGFRNAKEAVNQKISWGGGPENYGVIIGVTNDYHQESLKESISPLIHRHSSAANFFGLKVSTNNLPKLLANVEAVWKDLYPGYPFNNHFLNELFDQQYRADQRFGKIVGVFSGFTLFITCLGIMGLTAYNISKRSKEISIRKVLGSSISGILMLLTKDFVKLFLLSIFIATPIAYYVMNLWLMNFAYRIDIQWWMFLISGLLAILIALLTVSIQAVKAAIADPVKSLRSE